ncbi:hypothetical protein PseBG33_4175 [Pseudomonas synxantha BG33R]|jgi:Spy/CpxP family protein refolding chaperone|uniref:Secreted protein n=1 Tax=Pseudomonas synxantha TaxID=47883 RepID=A0A5D3G4Z9_9PSED|nr:MULTISPECIES: hypothetical protein [Pseudomonas]EIK72895.1 hypothetical protein PseBG33_4175 [Pseudomonas synxantha BG33R]KFF46350.1 hypothetical protein JH25_21840 [Pseudomonas sp. BRG-100]MBY8973972.1 hypothetical protein [Pseudomonas sp. P867]MCK3828332.1 hypothetical protein [Pseudomonas sp. W2Aug9]MCK3833195.1 hypothetical protein [Pseudomonas fluorescens]
MKNSKFAALALTGLLSAASLSAFAATSSTGPTDPTPDATTESQKSMGTGLDTNGGAIIDNTNGADPHTQGHDTQRQAPAAVGNGKMGPSVNEPKINKGDDSNLPGAPKQPAP